MGQRAHILPYKTDVIRVAILCKELADGVLGAVAEVHDQFVLAVLVLKQLGHNFNDGLPVLEVKAVDVNDQAPERLWMLGPSLDHERHLSSGQCAAFRLNFDAFDCLMDPVEVFVEVCLVCERCL